MNYLNELFGLEGRTALVTGGAAGVGRMIAEGLLQAGARVLIASRKAEACEQAAEELNRLGAPGTAEGFAGDVSDESGIDALVREVQDRTDRLHILVNNAGKSWGAPIEAFPYSAWQKVNSINAAAPFYLSRGLLPLLRAAASDASPARVVNVGSIMGIIPVRANAYSYAASKAALHHLTRVLADEFAGRGITFNAVALGVFPSAMTESVIDSDEARKRMQENLPYGRMGRAEEVVSTVLYLCGRGGSYTTGAVIPVDGGYSVTSPPLVG